jgi:Domain of unknown function DUF29
LRKQYKLEKTAIKPMRTVQHEQDRYAWAIETARRLRAGESVDSAALAEEIEQIVRSDVRELESRITQILEHLLKLRIVAGPVYERSARGWKASIERQLAEFATLLEESPSLEGRINQELLGKRYRYAATAVEAEYGEPAPVECPFRTVDIFGSPEIPGRE